jgi:phage integrase family site-specific recombinase
MLDMLYYIVTLFIINQCNMVTTFQKHLAKTNLAKNTIASYVWTANYFLNHYKEVNKKNLLAYKGYLVENFKPQTVNLRLQGINKYLEFTKQDKLKVKFVKVQQKNFLENVISDSDYKFLKTRLKADGFDEWYFTIWFMAATGARVSELLQIKAEHVQVGYLDLYSKGGKIRRLYIPKNLRTEANKWIKERGLSSGYIFLNRFGNRITTRGIAQQLKHFAEKYGINRDVVYPHSFRHRFAKNFLDRFNDLALLADLMGHESIETTRIYLRRTASEQQKIVDKVVNW